MNTNKLSFVYANTTNNLFGSGSSTENDFLEENKQFFLSNTKYIDILLDVLDKKSELSLRGLDWFLTNYSKKNNTCYEFDGKTFYVHNEYKNKLDNIETRQYFDPFCRSVKINCSYTNSDTGKTINFVSSIGQLNFFQWAIQNKVIECAKTHIKEIENDIKEMTSQINKLRA